MEAKMKLFWKGIAITTALVMMLTLAACSTSQVTEVFDDLVEDTAEENATVTPLPKTAITDPKKIDTSLAEPKFEKNLKGSITLARGEKYDLEVSASSSDGGVITYQWYKNNVNYNGGGSPITGATNASYTVNANEVGSVFYYVVAINNHNDVCNMATSGTYEITTVKDGKWESDEFGKKYVNEDGTYPMETWITIEEETYHFDSAGYVSVGWLGAGSSFYYFDEDGKLLKNGSTPDGYETDENGKMKGAGAPELPPTTAEIAQAAKEAAAAAAEAAAIEAEQAAAAEAAAAESQEAEEQPAQEETGSDEEYVEEYVEEAPAEEGGEEYYEEEYSEEEYYEESNENYEEEYSEEESYEEGGE